MPIFLHIHPMFLYPPACFMPVCLCSRYFCLFLFSWLYHMWDLSFPGTELVPYPLHWESQPQQFFFFNAKVCLKFHPHSHFTNPIQKTLKFYCSFDTLLKCNLLYRAFLDDVGTGNFSFFSTHTAYCMYLCFMRFIYINTFLCIMHMLAQYIIMSLSFYIPIVSKRLNN